ncbi:MAG TPA: DUF885 family protein [Candidatus Marinimicrobia bacterium]|nr:DUF885 family protein [Candidatus Neomarinimicrobiota bacterium]
MKMVILKHSGQKWAGWEKSVNPFFLSKAMKRILILIGIIIFGCRSSPETSFDNLNQAFISWYFKYHPVESTRYNMSKNNGRFSLNTKTEMDEYYADISRFLIELSQIDATKIAHNSRIDYNILYSQLEKMKYVIDEIKPWEWNPLWTLDELHDGLYILSERENIDMDNRVSAIQSRLGKIPELLENSKILMIAHSKIHILYSNTRVDKLLILLQQLPLKLNSDNITLDNIDDLIKKSTVALEDFKNWINSQAVKFDEINFPSDVSLIQNGFNHFTGGKYLSPHVYELAKKKLIPIQDRLFHLTLPFYLKENDEPVWLDRADTLEVIQWTIDDIYNNPKNKIRNDEVLSRFYKSLTAIEIFCYTKSILPRKKNKTIKLEFAPDYSSSQSPVFLFDNHPKKVSMDIVYNIKAPEGDFGEYNLNQQEIDIINAMHILPGYGIQLGYSQNYASMIRYLFPDLVTASGWKFYALNMLIEEGYANWDQEYHILKLKEEISIIARTIMEMRYYSREINREDAIKFLREMAFMKENEAQLAQMETDLNYFSGTASFIGVMELNSLLAEYKRKQGDNFVLSEFHRLILQDGIIPLFELKKRVLLP